LAKVNNGPKGENSPNLVTLDRSKPRMSFQNVEQMQKKKQKSRGPFFQRKLTPRGKVLLLGVPLGVNL
jgi:hypothetical protein